MLEVCVHGFHAIFSDELTLQVGVDTTVGWAAVRYSEALREGPRFEMTVSRAQEILAKLSPSLLEGLQLVLDLLHLLRSQLALAGLRDLTVRNAQLAQLQLDGIVRVLIGAHEAARALHTLCNSHIVDLAGVLGERQRVFLRGIAIILLLHLEPSVEFSLLLGSEGVVCGGLGEHAGSLLHLLSGKLLGLLLQVFLYER